MFSLSNLETWLKVRASYTKNCANNVKLVLIGWKIVQKLNLKVLISQLVEEGLVDVLRKKWANRETLANCVISGPKPASVDKLLSIFVFLTLGILASVVLLIFEQFHKKKQVQEEFPENGKICATFGFSTTDQAVQCNLYN